VGVHRVVYSCHETVTEPKCPAASKLSRGRADEWLDPAPPLSAPQEPFTALVLRCEKQ